MNAARRAGRKMVRAGLIGAAAFGVGCLPTGRLVARLAAGVPVESLGNGAPGASNMFRSVGWRAGAVVIVIDTLKGLLPVAWARHRNWGPHAVGAMGLLPVAGHITVLGGKGAATAMGVTIAADPAAFGLVTPVLVTGILRKANAPAALAAYLTYPLWRQRLGRSRAEVAWSSIILGMLIVTRVWRGGREGMFHARTLWERLLHDREPRAFTDRAE